MSRFEWKSPTTIAPLGASPHADTGVVSVDPDRATVRMIAAVTGGEPDQVGDRLVPGAFNRTLLTRVPKVCNSHRWDCPIGRIVSIKELMPGDPALPRRTGSGRAWPRECGALIATARLNTAIKEGKDALSNIAFFGSESAFSIGYKTVRSRQRGGVRELLEVDLFEVSPVLFGAHPEARLYAGAKSGRPAAMETKVVPLAASVQHTTGRRWGLQCGVCGQPVALADKPLRPGTAMICKGCIDDLGRIADPFDLPEGETVPAEEPDRVTSEEAYDEARRVEVAWDAEPDGTLTRATNGRRPWQP